ncbi:MAG: DUF2807 domain-containing protein [Treponema sp.]|nr:DUF2807 domain-containing protein [Treponema sp.]
MKKIFYSAFHLTIFTTLIVCLSGCIFVNIGDLNAIAGQGDLENFELNVGQFNRIKIDGLCEIRYYSAPSDTVTLAVQPNLREYYKVEVVNGELTVSTTRRVTFNSNKSATLTVSTPVLDQVTITGAGSFTTYNKITSDSFTFLLDGAAEGKAELETGSLYVEITGAGNFKLSGTADTASYILNGAGNLDALSLQTRDAIVNMSGAGTIRVFSTGNLQINADGVGTVEYKGSPSLSLNRDGLVSIRRLD